MRHSVKLMKLIYVLIAVLVVSIAISMNGQKAVSSFSKAENESTQVQEKNLTHPLSNKLSDIDSSPSDEHLQADIKTKRKGNTTEVIPDSGMTQISENYTDGEYGLSATDAGNIDKRQRFLAFWNSVNVPENDLKKLMNAGVTRSPNYRELEEVVKTGRKVIPLFGAFNADHTEAELRERVGWYKAVFERIGWENIECIILRDEPYLKNLTLHQMEIIIDEAKNLYKAPLAFTFTQNSINKRKLPAGLDMVIINFYPFFEKGAPEGYAQIHNYRSFKHEFDRTMRLIRKKSAGSAIAITTQVFGSGSRIPWRIPEPETAEWYMKAIAEHDDIVGLMFWGWESNRYKGLSENPELQNAWIDAIQQWNRD